MTLVDHAEEILAAFDAALADVRALDAPAPVLRVGAYESAASGLLAPALARLARDRPELRVDVREDPQWERFFALVAGGALDCAFADLPLAPGPFAFHELTSDPCVLVVRADSPLARRREAPTFAEIGALPLMAPAWPMLALIADHVRAAGAEPRFVVRAP